MKIQILNTGKIVCKELCTRDEIGKFVYKLCHPRDLTPLEKVLRKKDVEEVIAEYKRYIDDRS